MKQKSSAGFSALGLIGAVSVGSILSLGYINLSHFLIAQNALEQATRAAVRCVSPTNGECGSLIQPQAKPTWRYYAQILSPKGDVYAENYKYSAKMFKQQFVAETPYFEVPQEPPPDVRIVTYLVPTQKYVAAPTYKRVNLTFEYSGDEQHNFAVPRAPAFPIFDSHFQNEHDTESFDEIKKDAPVSQRDILNRFKPVYTSQFSETISGTESTKINADFIRGVQLEPASLVTLNKLIGPESATERCKPGSICSVRNEAGTPGVPAANDYKNFRNLALYLEVEIYSASQNASIGIKGDGKESGLVIDIDGERHAGRVCLGGRDFTRLNTLNGHFFNLWLRGASNSIGGENEFGDPKCQGVYQLSNLILDTKGGGFHPKISLRLAGQKGERISGKVSLYAFVDTYGSEITLNSVTKVCDPVPLRMGMTIDQMAPSAISCRLSGKEIGIKRALKQVNETGLECNSQNDYTLIPAEIEIPKILDNSFMVKASVAPKKEIMFAHCVSDSKPRNTSFCGWEAIKDSVVKLEVGTVPEEACPLAERKEILEPCGNKILSTCNVDNLDPASCGGVKAKMEQLLSTSKIDGLPIGSNTHFRSELVRKQKVSSRLVCAQERSLDGRRDCGSLAFKKSKTGSLFARVDRNWRPITPANFDTSGPEPLCGEIKSEQINLVKNFTEEIEMNEGLFELNPALEVSLVKPKLVGNETKCGDKNTEPLTLEGALREYAALSGHPDARDASIRFEYVATPLGTIRKISSTDGCVTKSVSNIDGCPLLRTANTGNENCGQEIDLGISEVEPELCRKAGTACRKVFNGINELPVRPASTEESISLASQLATSILQKHLPQSKPNCGTQNCTGVKVTLNSDKTVSASSTYHMPLSWPLDELLGKKSLELSRIRTERIEAL